MIIGDAKAPTLILTEEFARTRECVIDRLATYFAQKRPLTKTQRDAHRCFDLNLRRLLAEVFHGVTRCRTRKSNADYLSVILAIDTLRNHA